MIGLSPLSTGHPLRFQPKWVRPSTGSYPCFSLPMDSSPGFASAPGDSNRRLNDSPSLRLASKAEPRRRTQLAGSFYKRHAVTPLGCSGCLGAHGFRCSFTPLSGCFSPFPHGTGSLSVMGECSALEGGPPCFGPGFTCPALLGDAPRSPRGSAYGALTRCGRPSHAVPLPLGFVTPPGGARPPGCRAPQPPRSNALSLARARVWAKSGFARRYSRSLG